MSGKTKIITGLAAFAVVLGLMAWLIQPASPPRPPLPNPNGFDDFVKASRGLAGNAPNPLELSPEELRAYVTNYAESLKLARVGLSRESRVPTEYTPVYLDAHMTELGRFKHLALSLVAEGKLAELEHRTNEAMKAYLDTMRFGQELARGGVIIDLLVGLAGEAIGAKPLHRLAGSLNARECRQAIQFLETLEVRREPWTEVLKNERTFSRQSFGWNGRMARLFARKSLQKVEQNAAAKLEERQRQTRLLLIELAAQASELETGKPPKDFSDLAPAYLKTVPVDPHTGKALDYHF